MIRKELENTAVENSIYKYTAGGYWVHGDEQFPLDYTNIKSIVVDYQYDELNMPLMYIVFNLSSKLIDQIIRYNEEGVFIINIKKCVETTGTDIWEDYINDTFLYFVAEDFNKTDQRDYENRNEGRDDIYKEITVGLLSQNLINNNKKTVNGILKANNMASAVYYVVGTNRHLVMEPFENNGPLRNIFLPPLNSVAKAIKYLNGLRTFYNTLYRYFMDYDVSYLVSSRGKKVPRKGEAINSVFIKTYNDYKAISKTQGMRVSEDGTYYEIDVGADSIELADYSTETKSYTKIRYTETDGTNTLHVTRPNIENRNFAAKTINVRVPNDNTGLVLNPENSGARIYIVIDKNDLDGSIFTINKEYTIDTEDTHPNLNYSGKYLLRSKRELYFKSSGDVGADERMIMSTLLRFEKVK